MAEEEVATRAPESDAQDTGEENTSAATSLLKDQNAPIETPSNPPSNPQISEHCTTDRPLPADLPRPSGELTSINDVACYVSKPTSYPSSPCKLLLLLTSGTGIHSPNNQLQADAFAARGYVVVMPDQFDGDPAPKTTMREQVSDEQRAPTATIPAGATGQVESMSWLDRIKLGAVETAKSFMIDMWLARHDVEKVLPIVRRALTGATEMFEDAVANGGGVFGVGYCFGGKYAMLLAGDGTGEPQSAIEKPEDGSSEAPKPPKKPELKAAAVAHGTLITKEDIEGIKSPTAMVCVTNDTLFPDQIREQGKASLELNGIEHDIKIFDECPHGFAVVGEYADAGIKDKQKEAFEVMCGWLDSH